jgi:A/G-specific adenine glycosylase
MDYQSVQDFRSLVQCDDGVTPALVPLFQRIIYDYYHCAGRSFPWRETTDPYSVLVSEIMLQQTQTGRVVEKYQQFLATFPDFSSLAAAPLEAILRVWQGLGYNRRAIALQKIAQKVVSDYQGQLPSSPAELVAFPGIGPYTASAVAALAFNQPTVFIETNIREVYLYFFFTAHAGASSAGEGGGISARIHDKELMPLIEATLDRQNPREWYWALYDYGAALKKSGNLNQKSAHYHRQSKFEGSNRELRGQILRRLLAEGSASAEYLAACLNQDPQRVSGILSALDAEGFVILDARGVRLR